MALALAEPIAGLSQLTHLSLSGNGLGAEGATALAGPIARLSQLTHLTLRGNDLGAEAEAVFDAIITRNRSIKSLIDQIHDAIDRYDPNEESSAETTTGISDQLDKLFAMAEEIEASTHHEPTVLYDDYYRLACSLALKSNDMSAAIQSARRMSALPLDTLQPYSLSKDSPMLFAMSLREFHNKLDNPEAMTSLLDWLLRSKLDELKLIGQADKSQLLTGVAALIRGKSSSEQATSLLEIVDHDNQDSAAAPDQATLTRLLESLADRCEKQSFSQCIGDIISEHSPQGQSQKMFAQNNNQSLQHLKQVFDNDQLGLSECMRQLVEVLQQKETPSALFHGVAKLTGFEHSKVASSWNEAERKQLCQSLQTRYHPQSASRQTRPS